MRTNGITLLYSFMQTGQLVQKFKLHTHTVMISLTILWHQSKLKISGASWLPCSQNPNLSSFCLLGILHYSVQPDWRGDSACEMFSSTTITLTHNECVYMCCCVFNPKEITSSTFFNNGEEILPLTAIYRTKTSQPLA